VFVFFAGNAVAERYITVTSRLDGEALHKAFSTGDNHALIIGINYYKYHQNLKTAVKDAEAVAKLLKDKYFFDKKNIVLLKDEDATKESILEALRNLVAQNVKKGDNVFIYYAGHGWFDDILETGYWVTTEATKKSATFLENNIIYKYITALDKKGVQHVLMVSDSCFAGSFVKEHRAIETEIDDRYFREKYKKPSRNILASGGVEPVADGGRDGHSIFAYYFIKTLRDNARPYLSAKQLGVAVEQLVCRNSDQTPISRFIHGAGDEGGQFFFINSKSYESGYVKEPVPSEDVVLPKEIETSFDDILKAEEDQRQAKEKWKQWQQNREKECQKVLEIDESENLTSKQKAVAWQRFLASISQDNPYSQGDDEMRSYSRSRVSYWENVTRVKKLKPEVQDVDNLKINTFDIKSKFIDNSKTGKLFVITGRAKNEYSQNRGLIKISGSLFTKGKKLAKTKTVYCGNFLSDLDLSTNNLDTINKRLAKRFGDKRSNAKIKPGGTIPFMIVFSNLPNNLEEFTIKVVESFPVK